MNSKLLTQMLFQVSFAVLWSYLFAIFYPQLYNFVNSYTKAGKNIKADLEPVNTIILRVPFLLIFMILLPVFVKQIESTLK